MGVNGVDGCSIEACACEVKADFLDCVWSACGLDSVGGHDYLQTSTLGLPSFEIIIFFSSWSAKPLPGIVLIA